MNRVIELNSISKVIPVSDLRSVVLLDRLGQEALYGLMECARNVFLIDDAGSVVWQVSSDFDSDGDPFTNIFMDCFSKGSLFISSIEPETSIKKTKLEFGKSSVGISFPCKPIFSNL